MAQLGHSLEEDELGAVGALLILTLGDGAGRFHRLIVVAQVSLIGAAVERVFAQNAVAGLVFKLRVGDQGRVFAVGELLRELLQINIGLLA